ncbi:Tad domain-containing protein, partial [Roseobacter sp.]|uniref:Tad domain-containing protein n=1 Tax=Roseobacter sp. TaxID=1907202 RepID=UPI0025D20568
MKTLSHEKKVVKFATEESGAVTPLAIFFCLIFIVMGGLAVDYNKAVSERSRLQIAADSAAHAALYTRELESVDDSVQAALSTINGMLPDMAFGNGILSSDVEFGVWDADTRQFSVDASSRSAARVFAEMTPERQNASRTILLSMIGMDTMNVGTSAIYASYFPACFREGFVAEDVVDIQSGNSYLDGFCIHSNTYVSLNSNNFFEPGTVVSMPDLEKLDIPQSGMDSNEGLDAALRAGKYRQKLLRRLPQRLADLKSNDVLDVDNNLTAEARMATLTYPPLVLPVTLLPGRKVDPTVFAVPAIYHLTC